MTKVAFLGLGVMGYSMAGHLARAGYDTTVYNRTAAKAEKWNKTNKGRTASTPADAADDADFIFACVGNDDDLRSVTLGPNGAFHGMKNGAVFVDHTTASALAARELAQEAASRGLFFLDAPVSGGR
jgi:3-hydroxyisobutyrate dehydrogenase-like beta-hydroxyacid dehydrogenase